jgi:hypothetical protein
LLLLLLLLLLPLLLLLLLGATRGLTAGAATPPHPPQVQINLRWTFCGTP